MATFFGFVLLDQVWTALLVHEKGPSGIARAFFVELDQLDYLLRKREKRLSPSLRQNFDSLSDRGLEPSGPVVGLRPLL